MAQLATLTIPQGPTGDKPRSTVYGNRRIHSELKVMKHYSKNPRKITEAQLEQLKQNIQELGDLSGIVHDLNTDEIISGNQRSKVININECQIEIVQNYNEPNEQGTVAFGFVIFENQRLNYRQVRWNEKQREKACITANALGGEFDYKILQSEFNTELLKGWGIQDIDNHRILDMDNFFNEEKAEVKEKRKKIVTCPHCGKEIAI